MKKILILVDVLIVSDPLSICPPVWRVEGFRQNGRMAEKG
jgi:hypothetical protein